jgi:hypothetical protein
VPDLPAGYLKPLPDARPVGLRRRRVDAGTELWRVEAAAPKTWTWTGFPTARNRFDPESGAFRTRYAASALVGAFRERYRSTGLMIPADHATHRLVRLVAARHLRVLDLRTDANLDVLDVDDQISTGRQDDVWATCHRLADAVKRWWPADDALDAIVYRPRTTPETSINYAFFALEPFTYESWPLAKRPDVLNDLIVQHRFTVGWPLR